MSTDPNMVGIDFICNTQRPHHTESRGIFVDRLAQFNKERWEELASSGIEYARPWLDLDEATARQRIDPEQLLGDVADRDVLLLAGSGGQQSAATAPATP